MSAPPERLVQDWMANHLTEMGFDPVDLEVYIASCGRADIVASCAPGLTTAIEVKRDCRSQTLAQALGQALTYKTSPSVGAALVVVPNSDYRMLGGVLRAYEANGVWLIAVDMTPGAFMPLLPWAWPGNAGRYPWGTAGEMAAVGVDVYAHRKALVA